MKKKYCIMLKCGEGSTYIDISLTDEEYKLIEKIEKLSEKECTEYFLPTLSIFSDELAKNDT